MLEVLTARSLTVTYPGRDVPVLKNVDLTLQAGRIHGLLGRNGAGKSTLMHTLLDLQPAISGHVDRAPGVRAGWCAQKLVIDWFLGVTDNVLLGARLRGLTGRKARDAALEALSAVGLAGKAGRGPEELSGGEQQRLMIARTLAYAPDLYVLDEPFVGLDALVKENLMSILRERAEAGASILVSSHELDVLGSEMHDLTLLDEGSVVFGGSTQGFLEYFVPLDTVTFVLRHPASEGLLEALGDIEHHAEGDTLSVRVESGGLIGELVALVAARAEVLDVTRNKPTLNDAIRAAYDHPGQHSKEARK
ncbi:metal ABC transporter ATP-binding protein [Demequina sediminicola]|uniref:metal ABC transporter ATP-binding protein n=1 Tax=Demequina sediminicola TaxID=1095026 RepID=UPI0007849E46|nr:ABC transporter ATP-binding protein [Demequina sediminicola]